MEMFQSVLVCLLLVIWLIFAVVMLFSSIQTAINDRKREQRDAAREKRELEYHDARMKDLYK